MPFLLILGGVAALAYWYFEKAQPASTSTPTTVTPPAVTTTLPPGVVPADTTETFNRPTVQPPTVMRVTAAQSASTPPDVPPEYQAGRPATVINTEVLATPEPPPTPTIVTEYHPAPTVEKK